MPKSPPTVAAYFEAKLGRALADPQAENPPHEANPSHPSFHIKTGCGADCKKAIDAAAAFVAQVREAFGDESDEEAKIVEVCEDVILCFVYG